jgi:chaperonin GroES
MIFIVLMNDFATIKPVGDRLLVQPVEKLDRDKVHNGIVIPDNAQEPSRLFYVCAVGSRVKEIQVGERVVSMSYTSGMVPLDDGSGRGFLRASECMAVMPT